MTLVRWNPRSIDREINSMVMNPWSDQDEGPRAGGWTPRVDIAEYEDRFTLHAELPGMTQDEITVAVKDNVLTIEGEKLNAETDSGSRAVRAERVYGSFRRAFKLGDHVAAERIEAGYKDGVLSLSVPKAEAVKPRSIEIKVG